MTDDRIEGKSPTIGDNDRNAISPPPELVSYIAEAAQDGDLARIRPLALNAKIASVLGCDNDNASRLRRAWNFTDASMVGVVRARHDVPRAELEHRVMSLAASASPTPACSHGDTHARETQAAEPHPDERRRDAGDAPAPLGASHQPSPAYREAMRRGASELVGRIEDQQRAAELHALSVVQGIQAEAARMFADPFERLKAELANQINARHMSLAEALAAPYTQRRAEHAAELHGVLARRAAEHQAEGVTVLEAPRAPRRSPAPPDRPTMPQAEAPPQGPLARLAELCGVPESEAARYAVLSTGKGLCVFNPRTGSYEVEQEWPCDPGTMRRAYEQVVSAAAPSVWPPTDGEGNKPPSTDWSTLVKPAVYAYSAEPLTLYREQVGGLATPRVGLLSRRASPARSVLCERWLSLMFGDTYEPAMRLLARWGDLSRPAAALVVSGSKAIGKGLLATGLARWLTGRADAKPLEGARYIGSDASRFNAELKECPMLSFDEGEGLDSRRAATAVRRLISDRVHTVEPKGKEVTQLHGCLRLYIAHNTGENPFRFGDLPPAGRAAVAERLAHVEGQDVAAEYLRELGEAGRARLVAELPAHLEWNAHQEHATPAPGHERFGGWVSSYVDEMLRAGNRNAYLAALLLDVAEHHPHALVGLDRVEGVAWVKARTLHRWWLQELECAEPHQERSLRRLYGDVPSEHLLGKMLGSLGEAKERTPTHVNSSRPKSWRVPLAPLRRLLERDDDEGVHTLN